MASGADRSRLRSHRYGGGRGGGFETEYIAPHLQPRAHTLSHDTAIRVARIAAALERQQRITTAQANDVDRLLRSGDALGANALLLDIQGLSSHRPSDEAKKRWLREAAFREAVKRAKEQEREKVEGAPCGRAASLPE